MEPELSKATIRLGFAPDTVESNGFCDGCAKALEPANTATQDSRPNSARAGDLRVTGDVCMEGLSEIIDMFGCRKRIPGWLISAPRCHPAWEWRV